ncbi:MAG TPA: hypothetical protein QGF58_09610 [Myxococcota bacterium]|jgi:hypothetical protein|nr:hypothetical protein [Myxococcota bacterium]
MSLSRRSLLGLGLGGAALLACGGLALRGSRLRTPAHALKVLSETEYSVLAAIADRVAPSGEGFPPAHELEVAEHIDALLASAHPGIAMEIKQALLLVENALAALLFDGRYDTFTASPPEVQDQIWADWSDSSLETRRTVYKALTGLCTGTYWANESLWEGIGYPGPPDLSALTTAIGADR